MERQARTDLMGDVGSLGIGGALAGLAIMSRTELLMAVIAGLFVLETLSLLVQMSYVVLTRRLTGTVRRMFRTTPIHHHFEHVKWDVANVVIRCWIVAGVFVATGLGLFYGSWLAWAWARRVLERADPTSCKPVRQHSTLACAQCVSTQNGWPAGSART